MHAMATPRSVSPTRSLNRCCCCAVVASGYSSSVRTRQVVNAGATYQRLFRTPPAPASAATAAAPTAAAEGSVRTKMTAAREPTKTATTRPTLLHLPRRPHDEQVGRGGPSQVIGVSGRRAADDGGRDRDPVRAGDRPVQAGQALHHRDRRRRLQLRPRHRLDRGRGRAGRDLRGAHQHPGRADGSGDRGGHLQVAGARGARLPLAQGDRPSAAPDPARGRHPGAGARVPCACWPPT